MKKVFALLMLSVFVLLSCGKAEEKNLYVRGMEIVSIMDELAKNEDYFSEHDVSRQDAIKKNAEGDRSQPTAVWQFVIDESSIYKVDQYDDIPGLSDRLRANFVENHIADEVPMFPYRINSWQSEDSPEQEQLEVSSAFCSRRTTFVNSEITASTAYVYTFENAFPVMVTFTVGEDHAVTATGAFLVNSKFDTTSAETILAFFEGLDSRAVPVTDVLPVPME